ncbi:MAG: SHOCT domain-containing protein [Lachnospirales bacterium]
MLEKNLITIDEFNKIIALNRKSFSPFLAEIML